MCFSAADFENYICFSPSQFSLHPPVFANLVTLKISEGLTIRLSCRMISFVFSMLPYMQLQLELLANTL